MSEFTAEPNLTLSTDGKTATVASGFRYWLGMKNSGLYVDIETGFKSDGATCPNILRPFIARWAFVKAVLVHDKLCIEKKAVSIDIVGYELEHFMTQEMIDEQFKTALIALGMGRTRAQIYYLAVRAYQKLKAFKRAFN